MIDRIGLIVQDANSRGFIYGLQARLECTASFVEPSVAVGRSTTMTRHQARIAWRQFETRRVDLIVRFTDADDQRWQEVKRAELQVFPDAAQPILVCGVATNNTEQWLSLDVAYIAGQLLIAESVLRAEPDRTALVKAGLIRIQASDEDKSSVVERIVRQAPTEVFRQWLNEPSFRAFYEDCRAAALRADCAVKNEA
jgi:hypothetical protein